jgi:RNA polymerase sigma-70 factor (ECF subfamily)
LPDETLLINNLKAGDPSAFSSLVSAYRNRVINTCFKFLLNKEEAEDISQEVFIEVFQSIKSFRNDAQLSTWIYRIAVTKSLDAIKRKQRKKRISSIGRMLHLDDLAEWLGGGATADRQIEQKETMKEIKIALDALPDNQRIAFTLSKIDGFSNAEIAGIMKTSIMSVESLIYRAKKNLDKELENILRKKS